MTRKQVYQQIAAFTGDWKSARRKTEIFDKWCAVHLRSVANIELSFGKFCNEQGNYYGCNRNTLHFDYKDKDGNRYHYSILD